MKIKKELEVLEQRPDVGACDECCRVKKLDKLSSSTRDDDVSEEEEDLAPSFRNLRLSPSKSQSDDSNEIVTKTNVSVCRNRRDSDDTESHSESDSDEDVYEAKCPDRLTKKTREERKKIAPYSESEAYLNPAHHCGGHVRITDNCFYFPHDIDYSDHFSRQTAEPATAESATAEFATAESATADESNSLDPQLLSDFLNQVTNVQLDLLCNLAYKAANSLPDLTDIVSEDSQSCIGDNNNSESGYSSSLDSCSPRSSAYSPSSYRVSDLEASPLHENEAPSYVLSPPTLLVPGRQLNKSGETKSSPWNIPVKTESPVPTRSLPTTPTFLRRIIRPEPNAIYESHMLKPASDRIKASLNRNALNTEWLRIVLDEDFNNWTNDKKETKLMEHMRCQKNPRYYEILHAQLERIRKGNFLDLLKYTNHKGESALTIACQECYNLPIVARYIVDVMTYLSEDPDHQVDQYGNSKIIHQLVIGGDKYCYVLAELLNAKKPTGHKVFNINRKNNQHETALHIAAKSHSQQLSTLAITKLLIRHNANVSMTDINGLTPIHVAVRNSCNCQLLRCLLASNFTCNAKDAMDAVGETALHFAARRQDLPFKHQFEVMKQLIESGWDYKAENINNQSPLSLLPHSIRKEFKEKTKK